jgi:GPI mannosyltransferase 3
MGHAAKPAGGAPIYNANALPPHTGSGSAHSIRMRKPNMEAITRSRFMIYLVVGAAIALRLLAYSPFDLSHSDELMQYLEQGYRLVTGTGILPWESRFGIRNSLIPQLLAGPIWLGRTLAPNTITHVHLARLTFMALTLLSLPAAWKLGALKSKRHAFVALFVAAIWWESILFSNLLLSESLATAVLLLASPTLLNRSTTRRQDFAAAVLLGCGVLLRFQYAPFAAMLFTWTLISNSRRGPYLLAGSLTAALIGTISDLCASMVPYSWIFSNFQKNIGEGIAARFSTDPAWQYLYDYYLHLGPAALLLVGITAVASGSRYRPLLAAAIFNVAVHSLVLHKEYRFVWLTTLVMLVLAAIGSLRIAEHLLARRVSIRACKRFSVPLVVTGWALMSASSFHVTGGYKAFRGGGVLSKLAIAAAERPDVCGLAVTDVYYGYLAHSLLPKNIPLSIAPAGVYHMTKAMPRELASAANAIISDQRPIGADAYRRVTCLRLPSQTPCLYVRPGSCSHDETYDYQKMLIRAGM